MSWDTNPCEVAQGCLIVPTSLVRLQWGVRSNASEKELIHTLASNQTLATGWQTHHDNTDLSIVTLDSISVSLPVVAERHGVG